MSKFCQVIIDIAAEQVDRLYTYSVPEGMRIDVGFRVIVPFGHLEREGYVLALTDETDVSEEKLRQVLRPVEDYAAIRPELVSLAQWMTLKYRCTMSECLRLMIPSEMRGGRVTEKKIRVARLAHPVTDEMRARLLRAKKQLEVLEMLSEGPKPVPVVNA
ncbi:MAG: hypothetical protein J5859_04880, partial [Clostridia bacterium]|nr:hypothetical protein [Clostridia bacterium]